MDKPAPEGRKRGSGTRDFLRIYGPAVLITTIAFVIAYQFVEPAPPRELTITTGGEDGAYYRFALRYREILARSGIELHVESSAGSIENLERLTRSDGAEGAADVALVQGGTGDPEFAKDLVSLGSLYREPLWIFVRGDAREDTLTSLADTRMAIGPEGSGTRSIVQLLLEENGLASASAQLSPLGGTAAARALLEGKVDVAFFVGSARAESVSMLLEADAVSLLSMSRVDAYRRRHRFLSGVTLPRGVLDLAADRPPSDVALLAPTATLAARSDLHPALITMLLIAAREVHREGGLFEDPGEFPARAFVDFPLADSAKRFYDSGPPFLLRYLPFWAAVLVDRLKVMLLPLLTILFPLFKIIPPTYRWRVRSRIYRWYRELRQVESARQRGEADAAAGLAELDRIEKEVEHVEVPLSFAEELYHLRLHIGLVRDSFRSETT